MLSNAKKSQDRYGRQRLSLGLEYIVRAVPKLAQHFISYYTGEEIPRCPTLHTSIYRSRGLIYLNILSEVLGISVVLWLKFY